MAAPEIFPLGNTSINSNTGMIGTVTVPEARDGLDAVFFVAPMNDQLKVLEDNMTTIMADANLSDVQKQFNLQQLMNSWSAISQGMTNMLKAVADVNKAVVRNIE